MYGGVMIDNFGINGVDAVFHRSAHA